MFSDGKIYFNTSFRLPVCSPRKYFCCHIFYQNKSLKFDLCIIDQALKYGSVTDVRFSVVGRKALDILSDRRKIRVHYLPNLIVLICACGPPCLFAKILKRFRSQRCTTIVMFQKPRQPDIISNMSDPSPKKPDILSGASLTDT